MTTDDDINTLLKCAKLSHNGFSKTIHNVKFGDDFNKDSYCIFAMNKEFLKDVNVSKTNSFTIKPNQNGSAILCTELNNYEIRETETSNTLMLVPSFEMYNENDMLKESYGFNEIIVPSTCGKCYELKPRRAKSGEIYKLLEKSILHHHIEETDMNSLYDFQTLLEKAVMSEGELLQILKEIKACKYNGKLRLLSVDYVYDVIQKILECVTEIDCDIRNISGQDVHSLLDSLFPAEIIDHTFSHYFNKTGTWKNGNYWTADDKEISRCAAEHIFNQSKYLLSVEQFMEDWKKSLPEEIEIKLDYLSGLAVIIDDNAKTSQTIQFFRIGNLSDEPEERFKQLFQCKSHWQQEELEGFLRDIVPKDSTVSQLMMRFCRCSTRDTVKVFSKR